MTGWENKWSDPKAYRGADSKGTMHFPGYGLDAAKYLIENRHVNCIGIDTLSLDRGMSNTYDVHHYVLSKGAFMIENLCNLDKVPHRNVTLFCGPLRIKGGTGSPARIIAVRN
jgi:kynurenine formamidase